MINFEELEKFIQDAVNNLINYNSKAPDQNLVGYDQGRYDTYVSILKKMSQIRQKHEQSS